jgi:hypothetical protein
MNSNQIMKCGLSTSYDTEIIDDINCGLSTSCHELNIIAFNEKLTAERKAWLMKWSSSSK